MRASFLQRVWPGCYHKFSWPRRSDDGNYYQVCLECGVRYRYDWRVMRRIAQSENSGPEAAPRRTARSASRRNTWRPRERRLRIEVPVEFRINGSHEWHTGQAQNISRSGLLFTVERCHLPSEGSELELAFLMPAEICGDRAAEVLCAACVERIHQDEGRDQVRIAVSISDYVYRAEKC